MIVLFHTKDIFYLPNNLTKLGVCLHNVVTQHVKYTNMHHSDQEKKTSPVLSTLSKALWDSQVLLVSISWGLPHMTSASTKYSMFWNKLQEIEDVLVDKYHS